VIKLATDKTSLLLRHDDSEQLPPLDCKWDQNDIQFSISPSCWIYFKWRLVLSPSDGKLSKSQNISINRYVTRRTYTAKSFTVKYQVNSQRPAYGMLGHSQVFSETSTWSHRTVKINYYSTISLSLTIILILSFISFPDSPLKTVLNK
jgi:hypothetical protein